MSEQTSVGIGIREPKLATPSVIIEPPSTKVPDRILSGGGERFNIGVGLPNDGLTDLVFGIDESVAKAQGMATVFPEITQGSLAAALGDYKEAVGIRLQRHLNTGKPSIFWWDERKAYEKRETDLRHTQNDVSDVLAVVTHGRRSSAPEQGMSDKVISDKTERVLTHIQADFDAALDARLHDEAGIFPRLKAKGKEMRDLYTQRMGEMKESIREFTSRKATS